MRIAPLPAPERDRNDLAAFDAIAETGRVRHPDEFVYDDQAVYLKGRRLDSAVSPAPFDRR